MDNKNLTGTIVLVQPDMENGTDEKRGQIGVLTLPISRNENYVRFPEGNEAFYPAHQVLMLKDKQEVINDLTNNGSSMSVDDFKAMYKIMLLQDRGTSQSLYSAMAIAKDHPGVQERVLEPISPAQKMELVQSYGR
jgi:hypothetical protein